MNEVVSVIFFSNLFRFFSLFLERIKLSRIVGVGKRSVDSKSGEFRLHDMYDRTRSRRRSSDERMSTYVLQVRIFV